MLDSMEVQSYLTLLQLRCPVEAMVLPRFLRRPGCCVAAKTSRCISLPSQVRLSTMNQPKPVQIRLPFSVPRPKKGQAPPSRVCGMLVSFFPLGGFRQAYEFLLAAERTIVDIPARDVMSRTADWTVSGPR